MFVKIAIEMGSDSDWSNF